MIGDFMDDVYELIPTADGFRVVIKGPNIWTSKDTWNKELDDWAICEDEVEKPKKKKLKQKAKRPDPLPDDVDWERLDSYRKQLEAWARYLISDIAETLSRDEKAIHSKYAQLKKIELQMDQSKNELQEVLERLKAAKREAYDLDAKIKALATDKTRHDKAVAREEQRLTKLRHSLADKEARIIRREHELLDREEDAGVIPASKQNDGRDLEI